MRMSRWYAIQMPALHGSGGGTSITVGARDASPSGSQLSGHHAGMPTVTLYGRSSYTPRKVKNCRQMTAKTKMNDESTYLPEGRRTRGGVSGGEGRRAM